MMHINEVFTMPKRYNSKLMERLNRVENDLLEKRNFDLELFNRPRLEDPFSEQDLENKEEIDIIMKLIPHSRIEKNTDIKCVICLSGFKLGDKESTLPCMHIFHYNCLKKWLLENRLCPLCKYEL